MDTLRLAARSSAHKACSVKGCVSVLPYASTSSGSESNARFKPASALYLPSFAPEPLCGRWCGCVSERRQRQLNP